MIVVALLLVAIVVWRAAAKYLRHQRAHGQIRIGQTHEDVLGLMGEPQFTYEANGVSGESYSDMTSLEVKLRIWIQNTFGVGAFPDSEHVHRPNSIRRLTAAFRTSSSPHTIDEP